MQIHAIVWQIKNNAGDNIFRWQCACGQIQSKETVVSNHSDTHKLLKNHLDIHRNEKEEEYTILTAQRRHLSKY